MSDKGFGKFGSNEWHINQINVMDDDKRICRYVFGLLSITITPQDTLDQTKQIALELIRVH